MVSDSASSTLFEAFGGFDLDDKVISDLSFLTDTNGNRRLASFVWRQPTGPQEFALMFPHLDEGTLTRLLGSETQFAERFKMLAGAVSDSISEERFGRIPTEKIGVTAEELLRLTEEEKIIKYVSLLSKGQSASAKRYIQGMDANNPQFFESVEKAIFRILDVGKEVNGQNLGLEFEGAQRIGIEKILKHMPGENRVLQDDYRFINLPQIHNRVVEMASKGRFGTSLAMTAEEAAEIAKTDAGFAAQYRRSNFIKMFESKMSIAEDEEVVKTVKSIIDANNASFGGDSADNVFELNKIRIRNSIGSSRAVNNTEVAYRIAGQVLKGQNYSEELQFQVMEAVNASFNRQQFAAFGAEDGLGIYINKLGFATSLDQQREEAINLIVERLQASGATLEGSAISDDMTESILERMRQLRYNSSPVYGPEAAIDAALAGGGGTRRITGSVEELYEAARIYYSNAYGADPVSIRKAINEGISGLAVLKKDVDEEAYGKAMRAINPGLTDAAINQSLQDIRTGKTNLSGLVESLLNYAGDTPEATAVRKMAFEFLDVGAESVGSAAVARASKNVGEIFAYQVAFGINKTERIGFDRFTTNLKLSAAKGKGVPEVINVARSFLEGVEAAGNNLGGRGGTEELSLIKSKMLRLIQDYEKNPRKFSRKKLNELKAIFVNEVGIDEDRSVGALTKEVDILANEIASTKQQMSALKASAVSEIAGIKAVLSSGPHTASTEKFVDEMVKTNDELLKTMYSLNNIVSELSGKNILYNFSSKDKELQIKMKNFFDGLRDGLGEEDPLPKRQIQVFTDLANARLAESRGALSKSVMDYINQSVIDNPDDPAAIVKRLQALMFTEKNYNSFATSDPAKRAFGQILENIFSPQGDFAINTKYEIGGREYVLSDLIEFARAKTTKDLFEQVETQMDDIIGYIESAKGSKLAGQDLFSQQTLDDFGYSRAKAFVKSETESLIKVPETIQQLPPEIEDALARVGPSLEAGMRAAYDTSPPPSSGKLSLSLARSLGDEINPEINADLVNDLFALAMEKQEKVEDIVRKGFENRTRKAMGASISDESLKIASEAYLTSLRRIIALRRAQDSYEMLRAANPAMVSAIEDAMVLAGDEPVVGGIDTILQNVSAEIDDLEATAEATRRSLNEAIIDEVIPAKYTRAGDYLKRVLNENPQLGSMVKGAFQNKGKVLAGAATAAGLAIFAMKKRGDRTQDEISGPPLLPGGNPYENLPTAASQLPQAPVSQGSAGASYNVSINATQDQIDEFMLRAGYLSNGQIQGTMHNSLPDLGRNPYDDIAGSF